MKSTDQRRNTPISKADLNLSFGNPSCPTVQNICHSSVHPIILNRRLLLWIVFVFCFIGYSLGETTVPMNHAASKGAKVQLNCSSVEHQIGEWKYENFLTGDRKGLVYRGTNKVHERFRDLFSVDSSVHGHFNLLFTASENTAGRYTCVAALKLKEPSAEVIALDAKPTCTKEVISGFIKASCNIGYNGFWPPTIEWHNASARMETNDTIIIANERVTSYLIVSYNHTAPGASYMLTCTTKFNIKDKPPKATALNVPEFIASCTVTVGALEKETSIQSNSPLPPPSPPFYIIGIVCVLGYVLPFWSSSN